MQPSLSASPIALTVEIPFAEVARGARPPTPLPRATAEALSEAIGRDLQRLLGDALYDAGMVVVGALYDVPELLQPGLPIVDVLTSVYSEAMPDDGFEPSLLAIGGQGSRFPIPAIAPARQPGAGPLLVLPMVLVAPSAIMDRITPLLEEKLLHTGQAGLDTSRAVQSGFDIRPENLTYATFHDLCALMKVQMDHGGFGPLWNLVENALFQRPHTTRESLDAGNTFLWNGSEVLTPFYTLGEWMSEQTCPGERNLEGYLAWLRQQRQYVAGLEAHSIPVVFTLPDRRLIDRETGAALEIAEELRSADQQIRSETSEGALSTPRGMVAVEHAWQEMGPIAYTASAPALDSTAKALTHYYPMRRSAIEAIESRLEKQAQAQGAPASIGRPGTVTYDADSGQLTLPEDGV